MGHLCCSVAGIICKLAGFNFIEESSSESDDNALSNEDCQEDEDNDYTDE